MKNREITTPEGEKVWISRSVVVCMIFLIRTQTDTYVVLTKRGTGCPDEVGKWCLPCGYLDYDETLKEAASREMYEETGIRVHPDDLQLFKIDSNPNSNKQNVTCYYYNEIGEKSVSYVLENINTSYCEFNEVEKVAVVSLKEFYRDWKEEMFAFNHYNIIIDFV